MDEKNKHTSPSIVSSKSAFASVVSFEDSFSPVVSFNDSFSLSPLTAARTSDGSIDKDKNEDWKKAWQPGFGWNQGAFAQPKSCFQLLRDWSISAFASSVDYFHKKLWPIFTTRNFKKQLYAALLVLFFGVAPFITDALMTSGFIGPNGFIPVDGFYPSGSGAVGSVFSKKEVFCQQNLGNETHANVSRLSAIESIFALDQTFGQHYTFSNVKMIDMTWDILVGRGFQLLASWAAYIVFSDTLLRVIEIHPTTFDIFRKIALDGPRLSTLWTLARETYTGKNKRIKGLFFYVLISTSYIVTIPSLLSAMTGYDTSTVLWLQQNSTKNMVPVTSQYIPWSPVITGVNNTVFDKKICLDDYEDRYKIESAAETRSQSCYCQYPNGTKHYPDGTVPTYETVHKSCRFDYPNSNNSQTYWVDLPKAMYVPCNSPLNLTINGTIYNVEDLDIITEYCYDSFAYSEDELHNSLHCLPDTSKHAYQWGFSSGITGIFVIVNLAWTLSMYIVWQDAQLNSTLIKKGYNMTRLRAVFAMAEATKMKTGMSARELIQADKKEIEKELYGSKNTSSTALDYAVFAENEKNWEFSYRPLKKGDSVSKQEAGYSEVALA